MKRCKYCNELIICSQNICTRCNSSQIEEEDDIIEDDDNSSGNSSSLDLSDFDGFDGGSFGGEATIDNW